MESFGRYSFFQVTRVDSEQLNFLIRVRASDLAGKGKKELLWLAYFQRKRMDKQPVTAMLFQGDPIRFELPKFHMPLSNAYFGKQFEIEKLSEGIYYSLK